MKMKVNGVWLPLQTLPPPRSCKHPDKHCLENNALLPNVIKNPAHTFCALNQNHSVFCCSLPRQLTPRISPGVKAVFFFHLPLLLKAFHVLTEGRGAAILKSSDKERTARPSAHTCSSACRSSALPNLPPGAARAPPGHGKAPAPAPRGDIGTEQRGSRKPDSPALPSPPQTHQLRVPNPSSGGYLPAAGAHKPGQSLRQPLHPRSTRAPSNFPLP